MGSRYFIKGTQIGILLALSNQREIGKDKEIRKLINQIVHKQYVCEAEEFDKLLMCLELEK